MSGEDRRAMTTTRRAMLAGLIGAAAVPALAEAPRVSLRPPPRPDPGEAPGLTPAPARASAPAAEDLIAAAKLGGEVTYAVADARTGLVIEARGASVPMPPASTLKAVTALYALSHLPAGERFVTRLIATGPIEGGEIRGDLILAGGGDPVLTTDHLGDMAAALAKAGVRGVTGRFRVWDGALPYVHEIDPGQPVFAGYNPSVSGMNLNFNRVNFVWAPSSDGIRVTMNAEGERFVPEATIARVRVANRETPLFTYEGEGPPEEWTVARAALGKPGSRWLPVRRPGLYSGDVFRALGRAQGVSLPDPETRGGVPEGRAIVTHAGDPLRELLRGMLKHSTNITAEAVGMTASLRTGVTSHAGSARAMTEWLRAQAATKSARFVDHSGLGPDSRISAEEMASVLVRLGPRAGLRGLMKAAPLGEGGEGLKGKVLVEAKTGTLNFVSALAGYVTAPGGAEFAFAIFTGDVDRREAAAASGEEIPPGGPAWAKRSRKLQQQLIARWVTLYG